MHSCAQTNIQLFNQLRRDAYSDGDLNLVRHAYELAMVLFSGRFQPSGKSFIAHVVGTASILAWLRLPAPVVAAGLLHNAYGNGDFGDGRRGATRSRHRRIRETLGPAVEAYVAKFPALYWKREITYVARHNPDKLSPIDHAVLFILFADHLEHLIDQDVLYYEDTAARFYIDHSIIAAEIAEKLGLSEFAIKLREAMRDTQCAKLPVKRPEQRGRNGSVVIVPKSCRKRISVGLRENLMVSATKTQQKFRRVIKIAHENLRNVVKMALVRRG
jgi:(p)ppGpp synthase/HD superfamily hydrolase